MLTNTRQKQAIRSAYGKTLAQLGKENENIVVLDADLSCSTQTKFFAKEFPERFFNVGIAEQNLITTATGLAKLSLKLRHNLTKGETLFFPVIINSKDLQPQFSIVE